MVGRCCVTSWSKTQGAIAQRSAEYELIATVRVATEGIGLVSLARDMGIEMLVRLHVDASAALGIIGRRGVGRVRHLDVGTRWLQNHQIRRVFVNWSRPRASRTGAICARSILRWSALTHTRISLAMLMMKSVPSPQFR